jgi:head-tail adaptor
MRKRSGAGKLSERLVFLRQIDGDDGFGGTVLQYADQFTEPARLMPLRGTEAVTANRLQGTQPFVCTVRSSARTRDVTPAWRLRNDRTGQTYNIKTAFATEDRAWVEMLVVAGEVG